MSESSDSEDFIDNVRKRDAAKRAEAATEAARQRAIAPVQRPRRDTNGDNLTRWLEALFTGVVDDVAKTPMGTRNTRLRWGARRLAEVSHGGLDEQRCREALEQAARDNGLWQEDGAYKCRASIDSGWTKGISTPEDLSGIERTAATTTYARSIDNPYEGGADGEDSDERKITWIRASSIKTRVPQWVWRYGEEGRIQLGTLTMFAGKPAAGKSTASRWFASMLSRGTLPGCWEGTSMNVAMVSIEEQEDTTVVPSLQVAGADMTRIVLPRFTEEGRGSVFASIRDELMFTKGLKDNDIRAVFIDPVMSTFGGKADVYRNNEVRQYLEPFTRMAQAINGIVVCVHHLRKGTVSDVLGSMNGSSAFGEVPRAVFGFAPFEGGAHVLEQVKNSAGPTGLKLEYHLPIEYTADEEGVPFELPRFEIKGTTTISIGDIDEARDELTGIAFASEWLNDYLMENQPAPVWQVQKDAKAAGAINNDKMLSRASKRLGVVSRSQPVKDKPNQHVWMLVEFARDYRKYGGTA